MSNFDIYAAGLFDGEGSISLLQGRGKASFTINKIIRVNMTTPEPLHMLRDHYGGPVTQVKEARENRQAVYMWYITDKIQMLHFLESIYDYLIVKKTHARMMINYIKFVPNRRGRRKLTDSEKLERLMYVEIFRVLNGRGREATDPKVALIHRIKSAENF